MPDPRHEPETLMANLLHEVRSASAQLDQRDSATRARLSGLENSVNDLLRRAGRPTGGNGFGETDAQVGPRTSRTEAFQRDDQARCVAAGAEL